ncbi:YbhN family protein [Paucibacter sp. R3-3]|uniref:YbhN family protein n=1 Tax=Roseateles agri TaxID=3098619 RepID=A0ABU5D9L5_9BURK|nr:YbhN family protein [Paucibacter sp. R3-3]MDY0742967.1 YbhN family protein [Paucibacter sp. R3-3]
MSNDKNSGRSWGQIAGNLAWPVISLAFIAVSLWMLQVKLEAEVSSDPVVRAALAEGAFWDDMRVVSDAIIARLMQIPWEGYLFSGLATLVAYAALAWYDRISLMHLGRLKDVSWPYVCLSSFVAYALGHNVGASVLSGGAVRLRAYSAKGLAKTEVASLVAMGSFTFGYGVALLLGVVLLFAPELVAPLARTVPLLATLEPGIRVIGGGLLCICLLYILGSLLRLKPLRIGRIEISYPSPGVVARQTIAGPIELLAAAAIVFFALPHSGNPGFPVVLGAFLISFTVGLVAQVPGGVGVMEAVFLALMPDIGATSVMAALLVWRLLYLLIPLAMSGPIILAFEYNQLRRRGCG